MTPSVVSLEPKSGASLRASFTVDLKTDKATLRVKNCQLHEYPGDPTKRWVLFPSQNHGSAFANVIQVPDRQQHEALQADLLQAVDAYLAASAEGVAA